MRDDAINDHHTDPVVVNQVPSKQQPEPLMDNHSDMATASRPQTDSIRPEMVGMGDNLQTDPIEAVQSDNEEMGASSSIRVDPFEPLIKSGSQRPDGEASISLFKCSLCGSKFANSLGLERNTKKHPNAPICLVCLKTFATRSNLTRHKTQAQCKGRLNAAGYQCFKV